MQITGFKMKKRTDLITGLKLVYLIFSQFPDIEF